MVYKLHREMGEGRVAALSLGIPEVDVYLDCVKYRCRYNTWRSCGYDLQVFLSAVAKPVLEVTPTDVFAFIEHHREKPPYSQKRKGPAIPVEDLSEQTNKRCLATVSGLYEFLRIRGDLPRTNPVPGGCLPGAPPWGAGLRGSAANVATPCPRQGSIVTARYDPRSLSD